MEEEKVRVRLVFEDRRILSKYQKKQGLTRSWVVLNRKCHRTISEFSDHIFHTFSLCEACPHGLSLSVRYTSLCPNFREIKFVNVDAINAYIIFRAFQMEGFVLPPFESSCVLKDKDIVWLVSSIS